jgi:hypothetical protein
MSHKNKFKAGELVRIKSSEEILKTLGKNFCVDNLPFMPEMLEYCGKEFNVLYRIEKTCVDAPKLHMGEFINNDVLFLEGIRCSGKYHNDCQRGCTIFWKETWLTRVDNHYDAGKDTSPEDLIVKLSENTNENRYSCQSTELFHATRTLNKLQIFKKVVSEVKSKRLNVYSAVRSMILPLIRKLVRELKDLQPKGILSKTPQKVLNLQPGELVEVKSYKEIISTLDRKGMNKGLIFDMEMKKYCGKRYRVRNRLERMILEREGIMIEIQNTVILEGVTCNCYFAFGGCPRKEFQYWREIWLKRVENVQRL